MSDRVTQLQDAINELADLMCNAIGLLQQEASPSKFEEDSESSLQKATRKPADENGEEKSSTDSVNYYARTIMKTAKDIDILIDSLPSFESTKALQISSIEQLQAQNVSELDKLEHLVSQGQVLLTTVQSSVLNICEAQISQKASTSSTLTTNNCSLNSAIATNVKIENPIEQFSSEMSEQANLSNSTYSRNSVHNSESMEFEVNPGDINMQNSAFLIHQNSANNLINNNGIVMNQFQVGSNLNNAGDIDNFMQT